MAVNQNGEWVFDLDGGRLCLDFVNTLGGMRAIRPKEHLRGYADLVAFGRLAGAVAEPLGRRLLAEARRRPADADRAFADAIALREALYRIFLAGLQGRATAPADLAALNGALGAAMPHLVVATCADGAGFERRWEEAPGALEAVVWPIAQSAADLLTSPGELERVRQCGECEAGNCSWLFLDETKNRTRRWCNMKECGNRAKARRHYQRVKAGRSG